MSKFILLFISGLITPVFLFAASGACSGHGGVSCSAGPDRDGSVICVDGWTNSSVSYSSMVKCGGYSVPTTSVKEQPKIDPQSIKTVSSETVKKVESKIIEVAPPPQKKLGFWARLFSFFR